VPWVAFTPVLVSLGNGGDVLTVPDSAINCTAIALQVTGNFPSDWTYIGKATAEQVIDGQSGLLLPWYDIVVYSGRQAISFPQAAPRRPYFIPVKWIRSSTWQFFARTP